MHREDPQYNRQLQTWPGLHFSSSCDQDNTSKGYLIQPPPPSASETYSSTSEEPLTKRPAPTLSLAPPQTFSASCSPIKIMESKEIQLDTGIWVIPGRVWWQQSSAVRHSFDSTAPEATCHWPKYTTRTSVPPSGAQISPRHSERKWVFPEHKLGSRHKVFVKDSCEREEPWRPC